MLKIAAAILTQQARRWLKESTCLNQQTVLYLLCRSQTQSRQPRRLMRRQSANQIICSRKPSSSGSSQERRLQESRRSHLATLMASSTSTSTAGTSRTVRSDRICRKMNLSDGTLWYHKHFLRCFKMIQRVSYLHF